MCPITFEDIDRLGMHRERFALVYNFQNTDDSPEVHDPIPIRGIAAWSALFPVWDDQPFGIAFPPIPPRPAANPLETYTAPAAVPAPQLGSMPNTGHQTYAGITIGAAGAGVVAQQSGAFSGVVSYSMGGVAQYVANDRVFETRLELPAGVCVFQFTQRNWPFVGTTRAETQRLHWLKTKGIVQILTDADESAEAIVPGDWLQMQSAAWNVILAGSWNTQIGNIWALEASIALNYPMYVYLVGMDY